MADKSALARLQYPAVSALLGPLISAGQVATCGVIELEVLFSARSCPDVVRTRALRGQAYPLIPTLQADFDRAMDVMEALAGRGAHRSVGIPDLLIAAVAERTGLELLHYDSDFDTVASLTGQRMRWVAPRGSIP